MAEKDIRSRQYFQNPVFFADAFNYQSYRAAKKAKELENENGSAISKKKNPGKTIPVIMNPEKKLATSEEYLSHFRKDDRLIPVITLVIFLNASEWDGARSIHEMLSVQDEEILKYVPDYKLNLITPAEMSKEAFGKFHTGLGKTLEFLKNSNDKEKMKQMLQENESFSMDRDSADMVKVLTNAKKNMQRRRQKSICAKH